MNGTELEACIHAYGKDIYSFCIQMTRSREEANDLYQDTFLKLMELGEELDDERNPKSYLLSIAVHIWKNRRRKYAWRQRITGALVPMDGQMEEPPAGEPPIEQQMISMEEKKMVQNAVARLPDNYRLPIILFYMEEMKISQIASILKLPQGTVKSRLHKAKKILKKELEANT